MRRHRDDIPELLAPAGGRDALVAAVLAGADAVYVGVGRLNARVSAEGFDERTLAWSCAFAHAHGVAVYAALNVMVHEGEQAEALGLARMAQAAGVDALIVADVGLAALLSRELPAMELHLSTQAGAASTQAALLAARELHVARVTLARELSLAEIADIARAGVPVEVFCHGAICISYSGACAFSAFRRGRSAMRGDCTQPCRQTYGLEDGQGAPIETPGGSMLLCPHDYCGVGHVPALVRAGVASLKIEGRMKNPDYVANVVGVYRRALDAAAAGAPFDVEAARFELGRTFNRGFTDAYLEGTSGAELMSLERSCNQGVYVGVVVARRHEAVEVAFERPVSAADTLEIRSTPGPDAPADVPKRWPMISCPENAPAGARLWMRCKRKVEVGSAVHLVRAQGLVDGTRAAVERAVATFDPSDIGACPQRQQSVMRDGCQCQVDACGAAPDLPTLAVCMTPAEARRLMAEGREAAVFAWMIDDAPAAWEPLLGRMTVILDEVLRAADVERAKALITRAPRIVCRNLGEVELARAAGVAFDVAAPLYAANADAARVWARLGARRVFVPEELSEVQAGALARAMGDGADVLGVLAPPRHQLMVCEHCLLTAEGPCARACASCARRHEARMLVCADGARLPVVVDARGRTRIFDAAPAAAPQEPRPDVGAEG